MSVFLEGSGHAVHLLCVILFLQRLAQVQGTCSPLSNYTQLTNLYYIEQILYPGGLKVANVLGCMEYSEVVKILASMSMAQKFIDIALQWYAQLGLPDSLKSWLKDNNTTFR